MSDAFPGSNASKPAKGYRADRCLGEELSVSLRHLTKCDRLEAFAVIGPQSAKRGIAGACRLFQYYVEYWGQVTRRGIDDLQYLGGRGLLLQGLARLGHQPRVFHRNDCLSREVFQ